MKTAVIALITIVILWKYRNEIFAWFIDWIEPHEDEQLPDVFVSVDLTTDYINTKRFIESCVTPHYLDAGYQLIILFQDNYNGMPAERMISELFSLYEERQASIYKTIPAAKLEL